VPCKRNLRRYAENTRKKAAEIEKEEKAKAKVEAAEVGGCTSRITFLPTHSLKPPGFKPWTCHLIPVFKP
jgi:hypothetical protein